MDEMREKSGKEQQGEIEKIDLIEFLRSFQYGIKKMWWLVLVLALIFGLNSYIKALYPCLYGISDGGSNDN